MKICSLNARGLGERKKRRSMFNFANKTKADIFMFQETHLNEDAKLWEAETGGKLYVSNGTSNSRGVAILVRKGARGELIDVKNDTEGRIVCGLYKIEDKKYVICNIYGPNCDSPDFIVKVIELIETYTENDGVFIGGDFNFVMQPKIDRNGSTANYVNSHAAFTEYVNRVNLCDVWRIRNPDEHRFTWHKWVHHKPLCSRIDMLFIPEGMLDSVTECKISTGHLTDHSLIEVVVKYDNFVRGPGTWKLNNDYLYNDEYIDLIHKRVKKDDAASPLLNPNEKWEYIKQGVCTESRNFAVQKAAMKRSKLCNLRELKEKLEQDAIQNPNDHQIVENMKKVETSIEEYALAKAEQCIFRSKCKYAQEGEKCTAFFLTLEKKRYLEKNMKGVFLPNGKYTTKQKSILNEQKRFYQYLYTKDVDVKFALKRDQTEKCLNTEDKQKCESPITQDEFLDGALMLRGGKVPGLDGITIEFYRKFWKLISPFLIKMYQYSYDNGLLPESVRKGLISLLPKKLKDTRYIQNKRPLTLVPNDYKILAKTLDNRLREMLPKIIVNDQTGFIKGRKISHNVRKSLDVIEYARLKSIPAVILSIDMEKCFDRLEHSAILGSLRYFNFGESFIRWVALFYTGFKVCTQNFGKLSSFFEKGRGTNQGCPLSPGLYLLTAEILANKLRNNSNIHGVKIGEVEYLLSQFADDTDLYLSFDQNTLSHTLNTLSGIEKNTGLRISYDKTTIYRIGSIANTSAKLYTARKIKWSNERINTLGVEIGIENNIGDINISAVIAKMRGVAGMWYYRSMTLYGKVIIINSLLASLFVYRMQVVTCISDSNVKKVEEVILDFLWKGSRPKIPLGTLMKNKEDGGLGLVDIRKKHVSLLFNWVNDCQSNLQIGNLAEWFINKHVKDGKIWKFNLSARDSKQIYKDRTFWSELVNMWHKFSFYEPQNKESIEKQIIWNNSCIKVSNEVVYKKKWIEKDVWYVGQLIENSKWLTYQQFTEKYNVECSWLEYHGVLNAMPEYWKFAIKTEGLIDTHIPKANKYLGKPSISRAVYKDLNEDDSVKRHCMQTWFRKAGILDNVTEYSKHFKRVYAITNITKFRNFQYRLLLNKVFCNDLLVHWGKVTSNTCEFCNSAKQTIMHLLYECTTTNEILQELSGKLNEKNIKIELSFRNILFNEVHESTKHVTNFIILVFKQYIYRCKCMGIKPTYLQLKAEIKLAWKIESNTALKHDKVSKSEHKWSPVIHLISEM